MAKTIAVLPSQYVPWKGYFDHIHQVDECYLFDSTSGSCSSIKSPLGLIPLLIPVENYLVTDPAWASDHWNLLEKYYGHSPRFRDYAYVIYSLYQQMSEKSLARINYFFIQTICDILHISTPIARLEGNGDRLIQVCQQAGATHYLAAPHESLDPKPFLEAGITFTKMDFSGYPEYHQLYPPFQHQVSIVDLIFNEGTNAPHYMKLAW